MIEQVEQQLNSGQYVVVCHLDGSEAVSSDLIEEVGNGIVCLCRSVKRYDVFIVCFFKRYLIEVICEVIVSCDKSFVYSVRQHTLDEY